MSNDAWVCLITIKTDEGSVAHIIDKPEFVLGRTRETDLPVIEASVSRRHLIVQIDSGAIWIQDQNSANGTYLNEERLQTRPVQVFPTDKIRIGSSPGEFKMIAIPRPFEMMNSKTRKESLHTSIDEVSRQIEERVRAQLQEQFQQQMQQQLQVEIDKVRADGEHEIQLAIASAEKQVIAARRAAEAELEQSRLLIEQLQMQQQKDHELTRTQMANDNVNRRQQLESEIAHLRQQALVKAGEEMLRARKEADRLVADAQKRIQQDLEESSNQANSRLSEAHDECAKLINGASEQAGTIINEAREEAQQIRLAAAEESRQLQQAANTKANHALSVVRERLQREMNDKRNEVLAQAAVDAQRERDRFAKDQASQKESLQTMIKGYEDHAALLRSDVDRLEQEKSTVEKDLKSFGNELTDAKALLTQVKDLEARRNAAEGEWTKFRHDLEEAQSKMEREMGEMRERLLVEHENKRKSQENEIAKEKLKGLQDIKALIQNEEQKYTQSLRLRAVELTQVLTERLLPKLDEWIANPGNARIHMGTEIDAIVAQSMLNESSAIRMNPAAPAPEKIASRKKWTVRVSSAGGIIVMVALFSFWGPIYSYIQNWSGNGYAAKVIEDRRIQSLFVPPQTSEFHDNYTDNILYMKDYFQIKTDAKYVEQWTLKLNNLQLLKPMGLSEDAVVKYIAKEAAMIKRLGSMRNSIDKVYLDEGLSRMKNAEADDVNEIKTILGGDMNYQRIRQLEQASLTDFVSQSASK